MIIRNFATTDTQGLTAADLAAVEHDGVDCVIACMHWGNEYERRPNKVQRQLAGFLRRQVVLFGLRIAISGDFFIIRLL